MHLTDPERARERLERSFALNEKVGNHGANPSHALFSPFADLRGGDSIAAARWAKRSLQLAIDHAPTYIAQAVSATVVITNRRSPGEAAVLLGALRAHRGRKDQAGTPPEIEGEARYEASLRRALGDEFDARYAEGLRASTRPR